MVTPVVALLDQIETTLEGLTPPDDTGTPYRRVREEDPQEVHRAFWTEMPVRGEIEAEDDDGAQVRWSLPLVVYFASQGRGMRAMANTVADETNRLARAIEKVTSWPTGVLEVITLPVSDLVETDEGDVAATLGISALVREED